MISALGKPFLQIFTAPPHQWHPLLVHFPLVFLIGDAFFTLLFVMTRKTFLAQWAFGFLEAGFWSMFPVMAAGVHDSGLNLGPGNLFLLGLQDRWNNAFHGESSVSVHAWLATVFFMLTLSRLVWRWKRGEKVFRGGENWIYGLVTFLGIWCLMAMSYVGGLINHP